MIGNDIIDVQVAATESNWQRKGFLDKLFTKKEQKDILNSENPFQLVWLYWSMKESAYKAYVQKYQYRFFAPKKFECTLSSLTTGMVSIADERYVTHSKMNKAYIFTEAILYNTKNSEQRCFEIRPKPIEREIFYTQIKKRISRELTIPISQLKIKKNTIGVPKLYRQNQQINLSISLSHHGNFEAFSILNTQK